ESSVPTSTSVNTPNRAPTGETTPPVNEAPPSTTAATDRSVIETAPTGSPPLVLAVTTIPARSANKPANPKSVALASSIDHPAASMARGLAANPRSTAPYRQTISTK